MDSEKSAKKKELEATQKMQNCILEATNKVDDMETEIQKQIKVNKNWKYLPFDCFIIKKQATSASNGDSE